MRRYRELLGVPGFAPLLLAALIGRLPYGMLVLSEILLLRDAGFDYAAVGLVTAAAGLSVGVSAPIAGRLIDRVGQTRVLLVTAALAVASGVAFVAAVLAGASLTPVTLLALLTGLCVPPVASSLRTLLPGLVGQERVDTAFALDALSLELVFIVGPLIAAVIASAVSPEAAFLTGVALQAVGALGVGATTASRRWRPASRDARRGGALSSPGVRTMVLAGAILSLALGVLEIGIAAFAEREATRNAAGWLFALWGAGSMAGGLWYGAREWRLPSDRRYLLVNGALAIGLAPLPFSGSMTVFALLIVVAGLALAPSTAASYSLIGELAPEGAVTEAYSWQLVGFVAGSAIGAWIAGALVEAAGVGGALACAPLAAAVGLLVALAGRRSLTAPAPPSPRSAAAR
jgi:MFS family permease